MAKEVVGEVGLKEGVQEVSDNEGLYDDLKPSSLMTSGVQCSVLVTLLHTGTGMQLCQVSINMHRFFCPSEANYLASLP